jgi:hypothetical protein
MQLIVNYEVPEGMRDEIKRTFYNFTQWHEINLINNQQ